MQPLSIIQVHYTCTNAGVNLRVACLEVVGDDAGCPGQTHSVGVYPEVDPVPGRRSLGSQNINIPITVAGSE